MHNRIVQLSILLVFIGTLTAQKKSSCHAAFNIDGRTFILDFVSRVEDKHSQEAEINVNGKQVTGKVDFSICDVVTVETGASYGSHKSKLAFINAEKKEDSIFIPNSISWHHVIDNSNTAATVISTTHKTSDGYILQYNFKCNQDLQQAEVKLTTDKNQTFIVDVIGAESCLMSSKFGRFIEYLNSLILLLFGLVICFYGFMLYQKSATQLIAVVAGSLLFYLLVDAAMTGEFIDMNASSAIISLVILGLFVALALCFLKILPILLCLGVSSMLGFASAESLAEKSPTLDSTFWGYFFTLVYFIILVAICLALAQYCLIFVFACIGTGHIMDALVLMGLLGTNDDYISISKSKSAKTLSFAFMLFGVGTQIALLHLRPSKIVPERDVELGLEATK